jgi:hypothetical protein
MTVLNGVARRDDGVLLGNVTGNPDSNPAHVASPEGWFPPSAVLPEIKNRLVAFYLNYLPSPGPLDLAVLLHYTGESP